jgi:hypothetical protein
LYLSGQNDARRPKCLVSRLLPERARYWGDFSLGTPVIFIHKRISPGGKGAIKWDCWLVENSEQSGLQLVFRIYALPRWIAMPQNGAALWICVDKEASSNSQWGNSFL